MKSTRRPIVLLALAIALSQSPALKAQAPKAPENRLLSAELLEISRGDLEQAMRIYESLLQDTEVEEKTRARALLYNLLISLTTVIGGILAFLWLENATRALPYVLAVAASSFLYVAVADLIPGLHKRVEFRATLNQMALIGAGVVLIYVTHTTMHA